MSRPYISVELLAQVLADAGYRCGYCQSDERITGIPLTVEHLAPLVAGGLTVRENLWRSCRTCNEQKRAQTVAVDPETGEAVALYNPRRERWSEHFSWSDDGAKMIGLTAVGRATIEALQLNRVMLVAARRRWVLVGWHPPGDNPGQ